MSHKKNYSKTYFFSPLTTHQILLRLGKLFLQLHNPKTYDCPINFHEGKTLPLGFIYSLFQNIEPPNFWENLFQILFFLHYLYRKSLYFFTPIKMSPQKLKQKEFASIPPHPTLSFNATPKKSCTKLTAQNFPLP